MGSGIVQWLTSFTPWQLLWVFSLVNLINNLDRGIIPGAFEDIQEFINSSTGSSQTNALQGVLQSSFIIGFSVSCVLFGHLVHHYPPFKLVRDGARAALSAHLTLV
jgi:MFS family permease